MIRYDVCSAIIWPGIIMAILLVFLIIQVTYPREWVFSSPHWISDHGWKVIKNLMNEIDLRIGKIVNLTMAK